MSTTENITADAPVTFDFFRPNYYAERLSDFEVDYILPTLSQFCYAGEPSQMLAAYLAAVQSFEKFRRDTVESGAQIIEAILPIVPANCWTNEELGRALQKCIRLVASTEGEPRKFLNHVLNIILAEVQFRLNPTNES